jgi:hypothetical protein
VQIVVGGNDRYVSHVGREERELGLDIDTGPVPSEQGINGEAVSKIMYPRQAAFGGEDPSPSEKIVQAQAKTLGVVGMSPVKAIPDKRSFGCRGKAVSSALLKIAVDFAANIVG